MYQPFEICLLVFFTSLHRDVAHLHISRHWPWFVALFKLSHGFFGCVGGFGGVAMPTKTAVWYCSTMINSRSSSKGVISVWAKKILNFGSPPPPPVPLGLVDRLHLALGSSFFLSIVLPILSPHHTTLHYLFMKKYLNFPANVFKNGRSLVRQNEVSNNPRYLILGTVYACIQLSSI